MPLKCKQCNEDSFDVEDQVCKSCGIVGNEIQFGIDNNPDLSFKPFQTYKSGKSKFNALNQGMTDLTYLCHHFNIPSDIKVEASELLNSVYHNQREAGKSFRLKEDVSILAGCCIMNVQGRCNGTVTVNSLCTALQCNKKKVNKMSKTLKRYLVEHSSLNSNFDCNSNNLNDYVAEESTEVALESLKVFVTGLLVNFPEDIQSELIKKTVLLTELADSCWLLSGRSRLGMVTAAAFLCWRSMNPNMKLSIEKFCSIYSLSKSNARLRVPELKDMLLKLGKNIPCKTKNYVNENNIIFHLSYILENSESLRNDLLVNEFTGDSMSKKEYDIFRSCYLKKKPKIECPTKCEENMNASDIEISDTEISSYIRTKEQIGLIENIRNIKKCKDETEE